ncbi:hypothetical protein [Paenibacillus elgii]|uniref:Uncharacterized protein n=1 Tax=Paenibacillus elgii TaxID=189691 RepID=A0A165RHM2_9BACL|nr:hypothetical protein [Paenibacillus elgii]KZE82162.1 hypothetical protein AV654_08900 [Paenibacillus elgii]NEN81600.1 hypothetical protein [Paenibacillus elgii]
MFDPTIFDNLKVVLEGHLYDLDAEQMIRVIGREDFIDLASMKRIFSMRIRRDEGCCQAEISMTSVLSDFAGERFRLIEPGERPGAKLALRLDMPLSHCEHAAELHRAMADRWAEEARIRHERSAEFVPDDGSGRSGGGPSDEKGAYRIHIEFIRKIDESHIDDMESLLAHLVDSLVDADEVGDREGRARDSE